MPALTEAFPDEHVDAAGAEHSPQGHLESPGVGTGHDGDVVVGRDLENFFSLVDGELQAGLALIGAVRAANERLRQRSRRPTGALGAWAGGEIRIGRTFRRFAVSHTRALSSSVSRASRTAVSDGSKMNTSAVLRTASRATTPPKPTIKAPAERAATSLAPSPTSATRP